MRITPEPINKQEDIGHGGVFVFGSNESGIHGAGAAALAHQEFGARFGQGFGMSAYCFGIPTKDWAVETLPLETVKFYVDRFLEYTQTYAAYKWTFYVTQIGCGLAGFKPEQIAPLFKKAIDYKNVYLPENFIKIINESSTTI